MPQILYPHGSPPPKGYGGDPNDPNFKGGVYFPPDYFRKSESRKKMSTDVNVITGDNLNQQGQDFTFPEVYPVYDVTGLNTQIPQLKETQPERNAQDITNRLLELNPQLQGEAGFRGQQEQEQGLPDLLKSQRDLSAQLFALQNEAKAIPLQVENEYAGRATISGANTIARGRLRENAIKALTTSSLLEATRGNISTALEMVDRAVAQQYDPIREEISALERNLELIQSSPNYTRAEQNRALALQEFQNQRRLQMEQDAADKEEVYKLSLMALKYGAPTNVAQEIQQARNPREAALIASQYLQDPQAKAELQGALLSNELKKLQVQKMSDEIALFRQYGGLSPEQWLKQQGEVKKQLEKQKEEIDIAKETGREINENINQVNAILNSSALDSVVGGSLFTRSYVRNVAGAKGFFQTTGIAAVGLPSAILQFGSLYDEVTGNADDVVSMVEQIISQQFLDKLVSEKGQGATFGQLSDREGAALRAAASAIGQTAIRDGSDKVIGYDMSEDEFRRQMNIIQERLQFLFQKTSGKVWAPEEEELFYAIDEINQSYGFDPSY